MAAKVQLIGGAFQDAEGEVLANGYLRLFLNQDENVAGAGNICSGPYVQIQLDEFGNVSEEPRQYIWANDQMLPVNSFYRVYGYKENSQLAWGPNNQQVSGSGGTFDVGQWVPNVVISWVPPLQPLELQTNDVDNESQSLLDFVDTATVTWANSGGEMRATASGSTPIGTTGIGMFTGPGFIPPFPYYGGNPTSSIIDATTANRVSVWQFILPFSITISKITIKITTGVAAQTVNFGIYDSNKNKVLDSGAIDASTSATIKTNTITPVTLNAGQVYWYAQSTTHPSVNVIAVSGITSSFTDYWNTNYTRTAFAANATSGGVMPSALGTLTESNLNSVSVPAVMFEV